MARSEYHFFTEWFVEARLREVADLLSDAPGFARWWPAVYLEVRELERGQEDGVGRVIELYTKGWLPYTLRWQCRVTDANYPNGFALVSWGDFTGHGVWALAQDGPLVRISYDWRIEATKPLLRWFSPILRPVFAANHRWAMSIGERSLKLELARRRATTEQERAAIPPPPGPTWPHRISPHPAP